MSTNDEPRGVVTNGIGRMTTAHLNLSRSLADVAHDERRAAIIAKKWKKLPASQREAAEAGKP